MNKKNISKFIERLPAVIFVLTLVNSILFSQPWEPNDDIFNPSGIPSLSFSQPRLADLDTDGDADLILGSIDHSPIYFENIGSADFPEFQINEEMFSGISELKAEMGVCSDIDNDGDLDFITGGYSGLFLFRNVGGASSPIFIEVENFFQNISTGSNPVPAFADIDSDGDPDMIVGLSENGQLKFYYNIGSPEAAAFTESASEIWFDVGLYAYPFFCDLDNDHDFDLLAGRDATGFYYYKNIGDSANFQWQASNSVFSGIGNETYWNSPSLVDLSGDGKPELIYGNSAGPLKLYLNTGTAQQPAWTENSSVFGGVLDVGGASSPILFDFDFDGDLDMISGSQLGDIKFFRNIGSPEGPAWEEDNSYFSNIDHSIYSAIALGDVDGDDRPDAIIGDLSGNLYLHLNNGTGFPSGSLTLPGINLGGFSVPRLLDMDSDGDLDIAAGNESGNLLFFENFGTVDSASWSEVPGYFSGIDVGTNCVPSFGDLDMDGDLDIITGNLFHEIKYFENTGSSWIENNAVVSGITAEQNAAPAFGNLDGDGDLDIVLGNYNGTFNYYKNLNPTSISEGRKSIPEDFSLELPFPNPFNSQINFFGVVPSEGLIDLNIYNILGQKVYEKKIEQFNPGEFNINVQMPAGATSGIYIYVFAFTGTGGRHIISGKALYLK